jgi:hypothetical protein
MELNNTTATIAPDSRMIATMKNRNNYRSPRAKNRRQNNGTKQGTTITATTTRRIISRGIRSTRLLAISLRIGTTIQSSDTPRTETSTPGIAFTIPETETTALETNPNPNPNPFKSREGTSMNNYPRDKMIPCRSGNRGTGKGRSTHDFSGPLASRNPHTTQETTAS